MSRRLRRAVLAGWLAGALLAPTVAGAQEPAADPGLTVAATDARNHPAVAVTVAVPPELARVDLGPEAFTVRENGTPVAVSVERLADDDLEVVLAIDTSGSMRGAPLASAQEAVLAFADQMPPGARVAVIGFGDEPALVAPFTTDMAEVAAAAAALTAAGETALYDALAAAVVEFSTDSATRRTVVVLSDGGDTVSTTSLDAAVVGLLGSGARLYAVELTSPESDPVALSGLATAGGGDVVAADDPEALEGIFDEIAAELVSQYRLTFSSAEYGPASVEIAVGHDENTAATAVQLDYPPAPELPPPSTVPDPAPLPAPSPVTTPEPAPAPTPPLPRTITIGPFSSPTALVAGAGALFAGLFVLLLVAMSGERKVRVRREKPGRRTPKRSAVAGLADKATMLAERTIERKGTRSGLSVALERAGLTLRPGEFVVAAVAVAFVAVASGLVLTRRLPAAVLLAAGAVIVMRLGVAVKAKRRQAAFSAQLGDALQLMSSALRAGYGLLQAIDTVAAEALPPIAEEFQRLKIENHLGRDLGEALAAMAHRVQSEDFKWVVEAIEIHREVGGDLAEIIEAVAATIRDRNRIRRQVKALSAEGRISAVILLALPFAVAGVTSITNPAYVAELFTTTPGRVLIAIGLGLMSVGTVWMRKVIRVRY